MPKGLQEGEIFKLPPHLDAFLEQAYDSDEDIIPLSMGRGSGKTGMIAAVAVAESETGGRHKEIAASGGHENSSEEIQATVLKMLEDGKIEHREQGRKVTNLRTGSVMHFPTGGDSSGLAKTLDIILSDEVAYWRPNSKLLGRFESSLSKLPHARMIAISTRGDAPSDNGFEELLSREDHNPHIYSPDELEVGADPFNRKFLHQANPGIEWALPDLAGLEKALRRAQKSARALRIYKAFNLNLPTVDEGVGVPLLDPTEVARCLVRRDELPPKAGPAILGVDLGGTMSLSATCAIWPLTGRCQWHGFFPSGKGLAERGTLDRVGPLYEEAHALGELSFAGDLIIDEALLLSAAVALWPDIAEVVADPFRMQALQKAARALSLRFHERRVGYLSAGPDILELQEQVASQWLQIEIGRLMLSSIGNAKGEKSMKRALKCSIGANPPPSAETIWRKR